jgi:hypothetical protein
MCSLELKQFKEAVEVLERVLILNDNNQRARLELSRAYMALKMYENAKYELQKVLASNPPQSVKDNVEKFLGAIERQSKEHSYSLMVSITSGFDTNVNASATKEDLIAGIESTDDSTTVFQDDGNFTGGEVDAYFLGETLFFKHNYTPRNSNQTAWENSFLAVNQSNFEKDNKDEADEYDYSYLKLITTPVYFAKNYLFQPNFFVSQLYYSGSSLFHTYGLNPSFNYSLDNSNYMGISAQYYKKKYYGQENNDKELDYYDAVLKYTKAYQNSMVEFKGLLSKENALRESSAYTSRDTRGISLNYLTKLKPWTISLSSGYTKYKYKPDSNTEKRYDRVQSLYGNVMYDIDKGISLGLSFSYQKNRSNLVQFEYSKTTAGLMLIYKTKGLF